MLLGATTCAQGNVIFADGFEPALEQPEFVVVWQDSSPGSGPDIVGTGYDTLVPQQTLTSSSVGSQINPVVGVDATGGFVVVWQDDPDENDLYQIRARGFEADGTERFSTRTVNTESAGQQRYPDVAVAPDGSFVVVWEDDQGNDGFYQILVRGLDADGNEKFSDRTVNSTASGQQLDPAVGIADDGSFVVIWADDNDRNGHYQILGRGFDAFGSERFADRTINTEGGGQQVEPDLAVGSNGDFVVVWSDDQDLNYRNQILGRGFFANGSERFADKTINGAAGGNQYQPTVAMGPDGGFVAAWTDRSQQIVVRGFEAGGSPRFSDRLVNSNTLQIQSHPSVSVSETGDFMVTWQTLRSTGSYTIFGRAFGRDGVRSMSEFMIPNPDDGRQILPVVAVR